MRILFISLLMLLGLAEVAAQQPAFTIQVSRDSVLLGNAISVVFTLENGQGEDLVYPAFSGFQVLSGPNIGTQMSIMNGTVKQSTSYTFYLEPQDVGDYYIEPASIKAGDVYLETLPVLVSVYPNPAGIIQTPSDKPNQLSPFGGQLFDGNFFGNDFFNRDFMQDGFFEDFFRSSPMPFLMPELMQPDSTQQQPKKRKTTKL